MLPLEGIKVVEMAGWAAGPAAGAILGDWGADVIKIEDPAGGDPMRGLALLLGASIENFNPLYEVDNRNKQSIGIDVKKAQGRELAYKLIKEADVFLSNYREDALERLGLDYKSLSQVNPRLIYAYINGYGREGEDKNKAGYDASAYWARGGFMIQLGEEGTPPVSQLIGLGDQPTGMFVAGGIALALFARERTGLGQRIDSSLLASAVWVQSLNIMASMFTEYPRPSRKRARNPLSLYYKTKDDKYIYLINLQSDRYWPDFCKALELGQLEHDPKFSTLLARAENNVELISILDKVFATKTRDQWIELFKGFNVLYDPVNTFSDILTDPQVLKNGYLVDFEHPTAGPIKLPASPLKFNETPVAIRTHAPEVGEHTEQILLDMGWSWEQIGELKEAEVIT